MLKRLLITLICAMPILAFGQVPTIKDTTLISPSTSYTPQARYSMYGGKIIKQEYIGTKWLFFPTMDYLKKYLATPFSSRIDSLFNLSAKLGADNIFTGKNIFSDSLTASTLRAEHLTISAADFKWENTNITRNATLSDNSVDTVNALMGVTINTAGVHSSAVRALRFIDLKGVIGGIDTLTNGLTKIGGIGKLGGDLTQSTNINANTKQYSVTGQNGTYGWVVAGSSSTGEGDNPSVAQLSAYNNITGANSQLFVRPTGFTLQYAPNVSNTFAISSDGSILDGVNSQGLFNKGRYESHFTDSSLVTKRYVDTRSPDSTTFANKYVAKLPSGFGANITGIGGNGYIDLTSQSASPASLTNHLKIYSDSINRLSWKNSNYRRTIRVTRPTDQTITVPYRLNPILADSTDVAGMYLPSAFNSSQGKYTTTGNTIAAGGILYENTNSAGSSIFRALNNAGANIQNSIFGSTFTETAGVINRAGNAVNTASTPEYYIGNQNALGNLYFLTGGINNINKRIKIDSIGTTNFYGQANTITPVSGTNATNKTYVDGLVSSPTKINNASIYNAYGDSFTASQGASIVANGYMPLLSSYLGYGISYNNLSLSGSGTWNAIRQNNISENPGHTSIATVMAGFNDVRRGGSAAPTLAKINNAYTAIFANHNLLSFNAVGATVTGLTRTGTWATGYTASTYGGKTANGATSATNGDNITYIFPNDNVVIGSMGGDGLIQTYGTFSVTIDGVLKGNYNLQNQTDGISDAVNDNGRSPYILMYSGLGQGTHTMVITLTSNVITPFDYVGHLKTPANCTPLLVGLIAKMNSAGYAIAPANSSDAVVNTANASLLATIATWPTNYPVYVADINSYYNVATGLSVDNIHPNDIGHRQIFQSFYEKMSGVQKNLPQPLNTTEKPTFAGLSTTADITTPSNQTLNIGASANGFARVYTNNILTTGNLSLSTGGDLNFQQSGTTYAKIVTTSHELILQPGGGTIVATPSSVLTATSTSKGSIPWPLMTTAQQNAIASPVAGLSVYDNTLNSPSFYNGSAWKPVASLDNPTFTTGLTVNTSSPGTVNGAFTNSNGGIASDVRIAASNGTNSIGFIQRGTAYSGSPGIGYINVVGTGKMGVFMNGIERYTYASAGNFGIRVTSPTAGLHLPNSTAGVGSGALKFTLTSSVLQTVKEAGTFQPNSTGDFFYVKASGTEYQVANLTEAQTFTNKTLTTPVFTGYTVATLPSGTVGMNAYVTDALTPTYLVAVVGGGSVVTPVFYNGSQWVAH